MGQDMLQQLALCGRRAGGRTWSPWLGSPSPAARRGASGQLPGHLGATAGRREQAGRAAHLHHAPHQHAEGEQQAEAQDQPQQGPHSLRSSQALGAQHAAARTPSALSAALTL